jgi:hypothetical protein
MKVIGDEGNARYVCSRIDRERFSNWTFRGVGVEATRTGHGAEEAGEAWGWNRGLTGQTRPEQCCEKSQTIPTISGRKGDGGWWTRKSRWLKRKEGDRGETEVKSERRSGRSTANQARAVIGGEEEQRESVPQRTLETLSLFSLGTLLALPCAAHALPSTLPPPSPVVFALVRFLGTRRIHWIYFLALLIP